MKRNSLLKLGFISLVLLFVLFMVPLNALADTETYEDIGTQHNTYDNERYRCVTTIDEQHTETGKEKKRVSVVGVSSMTNYSDQMIDTSYSVELDSGYSLSLQPTSGVKLEWLQAEMGVSVTTGHSYHSDKTVKLEGTVSLNPHYRIVFYQTELYTTITFKTLKYLQKQNGTPTYVDVSAEPIIIYSTGTETHLDYSGRLELADCEEDKNQEKQRRADGVYCYKCQYMSCDTLLPAAGEHTCFFEFPANPGCYTRSYCVICGKYGDMLGHHFAAATCTMPEKCTRCGMISSPALKHNFSLPATCVTPVMCSRCGETLGEPLGHNFLGATCTAPKTCTRCHLPSGEPLGHDWTGGSCTAAQKCSRCGINGSALGHYLFESTVSPT